MMLTTSRCKDSYLGLGPLDGRRAASTIIVACLLCWNVVLAASESNAAKLISRRSLDIDQTIKTTIKTGDAHVYAIELVQGRPAKITVHQDYFNVSVIVRTADGAELLQVDTPFVDIGLETVFFDPPSGEPYEIEIRGLDSGKASGRYSIRVHQYGSLDDRVRRAEMAMTRAASVNLDVLGPKRSNAFKEALERYRVSTRLWRLAGDKTEMSRSLFNEGQIHLELGHHLQAVQAFEATLGTYGRAELDRFGLAALAYLGVAKLQQGQYEEAEQSYRRGLQGAESSGDRLAQALFLNYIGLTMQSRNMPKTANNWYTQTLDVLQNVDHPHQRAVTLGNVGGTYYQMGEFDTALQHYRQALEVHTRQENLDGQATVLGNMAALHLNWGDFDKALELNLKVLDLYISLGNEWGVGLVLHRLGTLYHRLGDAERAEEYYENAVVARRKAHNLSGVGVTLLSLGNLYGESGRHTRARTHHEQALETFEAIGRIPDVAKARVALATDYIRLDDLQSALREVKKALPVLKEAGLANEYGEALHYRGVIALHLREFAVARECLEHALGSRKRAQNEVGQIETLVELAKLERTTGELAKALELLQKAEEKVLAVRQTITNPDSRATFVSSVQHLYDTMIDAIIDMHAQGGRRGQDRWAFEVSERTRARSLSELVTERHSKLDQKVDTSLVEKRLRLQRELTARWSSRATLLQSDENAETLSLMNKNSLYIANLLSRLDEVEGEIRRTHTDDGLDTVPFSIETVQGKLDHSDVLLHYRLGPQRSFLWAITRSSFDVIILPARAEIEEVAGAAYKWLSTPGMPPSHAGSRALRRLSATLLGSLSLSSKRRALIVADGILNYIPFGTLLLPDQVIGEVRTTDRGRLTDQLEVINLPSTSVLLSGPSGIESLGQGLRVAIVADPVFNTADHRVRGASQAAPGANREGTIRAATSVGLGEIHRLPFSGLEAELVSATTDLERTLLVTGFSALKSKVVEGALSDFDILHIATHGIVNDKYPPLSGLIFSLIDERGAPVDGFLSLEEIGTLDLRAQLVVLSACETGLGQDMRGEGVMSLARGFLANGAKQVVSSLWQISDRVTAELMAEFYRGLLQDNMSPGEALRQAQRKIASTPEWSTPYHWGGFVVSAIEL